MGVNNKIQGTLLFVCICLILGVTTIIINGDAFTGQTLVETILVCASILFIACKYYTSSIIIKYQDYKYQPTKGKRLVDDGIVNASVFVVQPICLDLLYACFFLLFIKLIAPASLNDLAEFIYSLVAFNKQYIKMSLVALSVVLATFTLINFITYKRLKSFKKSVKRITLPFKVAAILLFFVNLDTGISSDYISWKINQNPVQQQTGITFNASAAEESVMKEMIDAYVSLMVAKIVSEAPADDADSEPANPADSTSSGEFIEELKKIEVYKAKEPTIKQDLYEGYAHAKRMLAVEEKGQLDRLYESYQFANAKETVFRPSDIYTTAYSSIQEDKASTFFDILNDERKSIHATKSNPNIEILEDILKEYLGHTYFFKDMPKSIHIYAFARDKVFDLVKDKFAKGFFFILQKLRKGMLSKTDVSVVSEDLQRNCKPAIDEILPKIQMTRNAVVDFSESYGTAIKMKEQFLRSNTRFEVANLKKFIEVFPHDVNIEVYRKALPLMEVLQEAPGASATGIDFDYWYATIENEGEPNSAFKDLLNKLEQEKDIILAKRENTSSSWQELLDKYPDHPNTNIIKENIKIIKANEALAQNDTEPWEQLIEKHPNNPDYAGLEEALRNRNKDIVFSQSKVITERFHYPVKPPAPASKGGFFKQLGKVLKVIL